MKRRTRIAFAASTEWYAERLVTTHDHEAELLALPTIDDVFDAVADSAAQLGLAPVETSSGLRVAEFHQLLATSGLSIVGEHFVHTPASESDNSRAATRRSDRTTRFVTLSAGRSWAAPAGGPVVSTLLFDLRNLPGALYKALGGFATNAVNMTRLESYMVAGHFVSTRFLVDVEGHPAEQHVRRALEELEFFTHQLSIIGVYPADPYRRR